MYTVQLPSREATFPIKEKGSIAFSLEKQNAFSLILLTELSFFYTETRSNLIDGSIHVFVALLQAYLVTSKT